MSDRDIHERLATVEADIKYMKDDISEIKVDLREFKAASGKSYGELQAQFTTLNSTIDTKLRGSLSGKEAAAIIIALMTSLSSIVIALLR